MRHCARRSDTPRAMGPTRNHCRSATRRYFAVTGELAEPPRLLRTVTFCGSDGQANCPSYLPPPLFVSVPTSWPVPVTNTCSVAAPLVLVASTRSSFFDAVYSARVTDTVSAGRGVTVRAADRVTPPAAAVRVTAVLAATAVV